MTDVNTILEEATQWVTESVTEPQIKTGQLHSLSMMSRGIVVMKINSDDELVGVLDRNRYSINSHEIWSCDVVSMTSFADLDAIVGVIKRILAEYTKVESEENHFEWQGGDYVHFNNIRFEFHFAIIKKKSMIAEW